MNIFSIPRNLRFRTPRDYESPWSLGEDSWDLIHLRMGCGSVSSWPEMYERIFRLANTVSIHSDQLSLNDQL